MDRHRRIVIKALIVAASSIVIGKKTAIGSFSTISDGDDQAVRVEKEESGIPPLEVIEITMTNLYKKDGFVDLVTLSAELRSKGKLDKIGGMEGLFGIFDRYTLYDKLT